MRWMGQVSGAVLAFFAGGFAVCPTSAPAQQPIDEALAAAYEQLKADSSAKNEQIRHRMLTEMADRCTQYAEAAFQATEDLQSYAAKVRATGLMFRTPLAKVKQFDKGLKKLTHKAFKGQEPLARHIRMASARLHHLPVAVVS